MMRGKSKAEAQKIAIKLTKQITKLLPYPMELKFEKVMCPFAALAKKRYFGLLPNGEMLIKGIEVARRDGCPALVKIFRESLNIILTTQNLSKMKAFLQSNWIKIEQDYLNVHDLIFAKEVKMGGYKQMPAAGYAAEKRASFDPNLAASYKERIKYIVVANPDSKKLRDNVLPIEQFFANCSMPLNAAYYNESVLNKAIGRFTQTMNINIDRWYRSRGHGSSRLSLMSYDEILASRQGVKATNSMKSYTTMAYCLVCRKPSKSSICADCRNDTESVPMKLALALEIYQDRYDILNGVCQRCQSDTDTLKCINYDCHTLYSIIRSSESLAIIQQKAKAAMVEYLKMNR